MAFLAYLATTGRAHSREALATLLWPEQDESRGRASLRYTLWTLKKRFVLHHFNQETGT